MEHKFFTQILKYILISTALDCLFFVRAFIRILIKIFRHISGIRIVYRGRKDLEFFSLLKVVPGKKMWKTLFLFIKTFCFRIKIWLRSIENRLRCIFFNMKVSGRSYKQSLSVEPIFSPEHGQLFIETTEVAFREQNNK